MRTVSVFVLLDVGLAFLLFTSLNMIITNTKEDHFIIRGLPNIDLQIFRFNTLHRRKEGGKVIGSLWCVCCYLISGWDCLLFLVKSRRITLGWAGDTTHLITPSCVEEFILYYADLLRSFMQSLLFELRTNL